MGHLSRRNGWSGLRNVDTSMLEHLGPVCDNKCMTRRGGSMHVATTRRQHKDKVYETHLLRRSYREDGKVKNETVANLSHLPAATIELVRASLEGAAFVPAAGVEVARSLPHGHVAAAWAQARALGLPEMLGPAGRL